MVLDHESTPVTDNTPELGDDLLLTGFHQPVIPKLFYRFTQYKIEQRDDGTTTYITDDQHPMQELELSIKCETNDLLLPSIETYSSRYNLFNQLDDEFCGEPTPKIIDGTTVFFKECVRFHPRRQTDGCTVNLEKGTIKTLEGDDIEFSFTGTLEAVHDPSREINATYKMQLSLDEFFVY